MSTPSREETAIFPPRVLATAGALVLVVLVVVAFVVGRASATEHVTENVTFTTTLLTMKSQDGSTTACFDVPDEGKECTVAIFREGSPVDVGDTVRVTLVLLADDGDGVHMFYVRPAG